VEFHGAKIRNQESGVRNQFISVYQEISPEKDPEALAFIDPQVQKPVYV
jgi:hypothetical protein